MTFGIHSSIYLQQCIIMSRMIRESTLLLQMLPEPIKPHVLPLSQRPTLKTLAVPRIKTMKDIDAA